MIIKSHIRGGFRAAAQYLKDIGKNESTRLIAISDPDARNLDEAFRNMWIVASSTKAKKPLHHISINPATGERLTDEQVLQIVERAEEKYGYKNGDHQRVIVEHVLRGRQHFHVIWNRVSLTTNRAVWPGEHWKKSKQVCREMEEELGLQRPVPRRLRKKRLTVVGKTRGVMAKIGLVRPVRLEPFAPTGAIKPVRRKVKPSKAKRPTRPFKAMASTKGWPQAAILAWESWGKFDPVRFYLLWSELAPVGFSPSG